MAEEAAESGRHPFPICHLTPKQRDVFFGEQCRPTQYGSDRVFGGFDAILTGNRYPPRVHHDGAVSDRDSSFHSQFGFGEANRLQALARLSVSAHADAYNVGLVLAGLRSTAFCYLWFKSRFIPRALAAWGMVASFLMGACAFSFIIFPEIAKVIPVEIYGAPIFLFELTMGFWLLLKGLPPSGAAPDRVSGSAQAGVV